MNMYFIFIYTFLKSYTELKTIIRILLGMSLMLLIIYIVETNASIPSNKYRSMPVKSSTGNFDNSHLKLQFPRITLPLTHSHRL
jgi:hypothetical protein